jgi:hypothetical protein
VDLTKFLVDNCTILCDMVEMSKTFASIILFLFDVMPFA